LFLKFESHNKLLHSIKTDSKASKKYQKFSQIKF